MKEFKKEERQGGGKENSTWGPLENTIMIAPEQSHDQGIQQYVKKT